MKTQLVIQTSCFFFLEKGSRRVSSAVGAFCNPCPCMSWVCPYVVILAQHNHLFFLPSNKLQNVTLKLGPPRQGRNRESHLVPSRLLVSYERSAVQGSARGNGKEGNKRERRPSFLLSITPTLCLDRASLGIRQRRVTHWYIKSTHDADDS